MSSDNDLVERLRDGPCLDSIDTYETTQHAADRIEELEYALRSIADTPIGAEIPDRTTIWGLAKHMQETARDALKEEKDEQ